MGQKREGGIGIRETTLTIQSGKNQNPNQSERKGKENSSPQTPQQEGQDPIKPRQTMKEREPGYPKNNFTTSKKLWAI